MILHIDMDAFFAAVEQRDRPQLRGKPVVVGGSTGGRGVVSAASYEARRYGIHSAMSGKRARELCPQAVFVRGDLKKYAAVGRQVREIFHRYTPRVQPLSLDEAFLDVSGTTHLFGGAEAIGRTIKQAIADELRLAASVGIAPLKFVAKIASDIDKPDGFVVVPAEQVQTFLDPLPIARLWGVGRVGQQRLTRIGIERIADLRHRNVTDLEAKFGRWGRHLWELANGIDPREVVPDRQAKSIGHERTFAEDWDDEEILASAVGFLAEQVGYRLRQVGRCARSVTLKYRRADFRTFSRQATLRPASQATALITETALGLLREIRTKTPGKVRLLGVSAGQLTEPGEAVQMSLFDPVGRDGQLDRLLDQLHDAERGDRVYRASSHRYRNRKRSP